MNTLALLFSSPFGLVWIFILFGITVFIFWVVTIVEIATGKFRDDTSKIVWLLVVLLLGVLGSLIYIIAGRQSKIAV